MLRTLTLLALAGTLTLHLGPTHAAGETVPLPPGTLTFPTGWTIEKNGKGSVIASPEGPRQSTYFAFVQSCTTSDSRDCDPSCTPEAIQRNFFPTKMATSVSTPSGTLKVVMEDSQLVDGRPSYSYREFHCRSGRLFAISAMSKNSAAQSRDLVNQIVGTMKWR